MYKSPARILKWIRINQKKKEHQPETIHHYHSIFLPTCFQSTMTDSWTTNLSVADPIKTCFILQSKCTRYYFQVTSYINHSHSKSPARHILADMSKLSQNMAWLKTLITWTYLNFRNHPNKYCYFKLSEESFSRNKNITMVVILTRTLKFYSLINWYPWYAWILFYHRSPQNVMYFPNFFSYMWARECFLQHRGMTDVTVRAVGLYN